MASIQSHSSIIGHKLILHAYSITAALHHKSLYDSAKPDEREKTSTCEYQTSTECAKPSPNNHHLEAKDIACEGQSCFNVTVGDVLHRQMVCWFDLLSERHTTYDRERERDHSRGNEKTKSSAQLRGRERGGDARLDRAVARQSPGPSSVRAREEMDAKPIVREALCC